MWIPTRWWRAIGPDGEIWCESSNEQEVRDSARGDDRVENLWSTEPEYEWREVDKTITIKEDGYGFPRDVH